ncbi:hypothetical protein GGR92_004822 [Spirosoma lacussanchae]|uniref:hypothetical protein n=1 Tax=Spirosoma lacussanchae TaxID=1884249 RepID=UPI001108A76C|nr:hypothetical protein [Spirosoma lacussanchae]
MNQSLIPTTPADVHTIAQSLASSGYFKDASDATKAFVKVLAGAELGLPAFQSMSGIHIVQGKPSLGGGLIASLIKRSGKYNYRVVKHDATICQIEFTEGGQVIGESVFTMAEAKAANINMEWNREKGGWQEKATWKNFPKNMLFNRAMSNGAKWHCPDVFGGPVYTEGELEEAPVVQDTTAEVVESRRKPYEKEHEYQARIQPAAVEATVTTQPAAEPVKMSKKESAELMKALDEWNKAVGLMVSDPDQVHSPESYDKAAEALGKIPNLNREEKIKMFRGLVALAEEQGVDYDKETKRFYATPEAAEMAQQAIGEEVPIE